MTDTLEVRASRRYQVQIGQGLLDELGARLLNVTRPCTAVLVSGPQVTPLYARRAGDSLGEAGFRVVPYQIEAGESAKSLQSYGELLHFLSRSHVTRGDLLVALGGGVTGDLTGFAAATYQRGVGFVQVPTTLLAAVDSSVGGKTAVNLDTGKNQVGSFYQPMLVLCDIDCLRTLPEREYRCGSAEVIKTAMLGDRELFADLEKTPIRAQEQKVIRRCVEIKRDIVAEDEFDRGRRMLLNLGHTVGHAVEACSGYSVLHGQAVAVGMAVITRAAAAKGLCSSEDRDRLLALLKKNELPTETDIPREALVQAIAADKKLSGSTLRLVVPEAVGRCKVLAVPLDEIDEWLRLGGIA